MVTITILNLWFTIYALWLDLKWHLGSQSAIIIVSFNLFPRLAPQKYFSYNSTHLLYSRRDVLIWKFFRNIAFWSCVLLDDLVHTMKGTETERTRTISSSGQVNFRNYQPGKLHGSWWCPTPDIKHILPGFSLPYVVSSRPWVVRLRTCERVLNNLSKV